MDLLLKSKTLIKKKPILRTFWNRVKFWSLVSLIKKQFSIADIDEENFTALVELGDETTALVSLDCKTNTVYVETTIIFDTVLLNLKTLSSINDIAYYYGNMVGGAGIKNESQCGLYVSRKCKLSSGNVCIELEKHRDFLIALQNYLESRVVSQNADNLDISMFEDLDLTLFNPKAIGERKDFCFGDWESFRSSVVEDGEEYSSYLAEVEACALFEERNDLRLSEVGDMVLDEIIWNRQLIITAADDDYSVN